MTGKRHRSSGTIERGASAGFTLIETLVVVTILGLALTIVAGFLPRRNAALDLADATSRVTNAMRVARARAIAESRKVPFAVTRDGHGFQVDSSVVGLGASISVVLTDRRAIVFEPDGSASGGILRVQTGGRARTVRVDWLTGRVSVVEAS